MELPEYVDKAVIDLKYCSENDLISSPLKALPVLQAKVFNLKSVESVLVL